MNRKLISRGKFAVTFLLILFSPLAADEIQGLNRQVNLIRLKKIATEWQNATVTLQTRTNITVTGQLLSMTDGYFQLRQDHEVISVPLNQVIAVSREPGRAELFLSLASAAMGSAFLTGALVVTTAEPGPLKTGIAALAGFLGGGLWGYATFWEREVIKLE